MGGAAQHTTANPPPLREMGIATGRPPVPHSTLRGAGAPEFLSSLHFPPPARVSRTFPCAPARSSSLTSSQAGTPAPPYRRTLGRRRTPRRQGRLRHPPPRQNPRQKKNLDNGLRKCKLVNAFRYVLPVPRVRRGTGRCGEKEKQVLTFLGAETIFPQFFFGSVGGIAIFQPWMSCRRRVPGSPHRTLSP